MKTRISDVHVFCGVFLLAHISVYGAVRFDANYLLPVAVLGPIYWFTAKILWTRRDRPYFARAVMSLAAAALWFLYFVFFMVIVGKMVG